MVIPKDIETLIEDISAAQAYEVIKALGNPKVQVFSNGLLYNIADVIAEDGGMKAKYIGPFQFWGGPVTMLRYYTGNLYMLLCDRILDVIANHGYRAARECICIPQKEKVRVWL